MNNLLNKLFRRKPEPSGKPNLKLQMTTKRSQPFRNHMNIPPGDAVDFVLPVEVNKLISDRIRAGAVITTESAKPVEIAPKSFTQDHHIKADGKILATITMSFNSK